MTGPRPAPRPWLVYLKLGRVSNLPTVWSNCLAGGTLALHDAPPPLIAWVAVAVSLFYMAGMFLNDAFDAEHDRVARPERPIPSGWADRRRVMTIGFGLLAAGQALLMAAAPDTRPAVAMYGSALAALIVYYDWRHKRDRWSAVVMGLCRALVYFVAAAAVAGLVAPEVIRSAVLLALYVIVLSQIAKRDLLSGRYIAMLIAGISLVDAALIAAVTGDAATAAAAALGFPLTLLLQRIAPGT